MILQALSFYLFSIVAIAAATMVVFARNPVHSVLFLILTFFNAAGLFVLMGAEFLAMILVVVYVGAVAVLFLFVVMMLDVNFVRLREGFMKYLPLGALIGLAFLAELILIAVAWTKAPIVISATGTSAAPIDQSLTNTEALGHLLYTNYFFLFQAAGFILLVAMIGAIVLTLRHRAGTRRQDITKQLSRKKADSVTLVDVPTGSGV